MGYGNPAKPARETMVAVALARVATWVAGAVWLLGLGYIVTRRSEWHVALGFVTAVTALLVVHTWLGTTWRPIRLASRLRGSLFLRAIDCLLIALAAGLYIA